MTGVAKTTYHIGRLSLVGICMLMYIRWRIWRAKYAFRDELVRNGVPRESVNALVSSYNTQNKQFLGSLVGFTRFRR